MLALYLRFTSWLKAQDGQDLIEYALLAGFIALVAVVAVIATGQDVAALFGRVSGQLGDVP